MADLGFLERLAAGQRSRSPTGRMLRDPNIRASQGGGGIGTLLDMNSPEALQGDPKPYNRVTSRVPYEPPVEPPTPRGPLDIIDTLTGAGDGGASVLDLADVVTGGRDDPIFNPLEDAVDTANRKKPGDLGAWLKKKADEAIENLKKDPWRRTPSDATEPTPYDPALAYDSPSESGGRFGGTGLGTPEVTVVEPEKKEEPADTSSAEQDIFDYYSTIDTLFPAYDTSNPKQDAADAYAERANERTALLAQLALGGAMVAGSGKSWEGMGKGFIGMAGMYDQGYERYQKALQTSADRYASTQKDAQGYDLAKRQAALELYTSGQTNARETAKDERDFLLRVATEDRQVQEMRRAEAKEIFAPELERFKRIEGDPYEQEDIELIAAQRNALSEAINHYIKTGQVTRPRAIVKPTTK